MLKGKKGIWQGEALLCKHLSCEALATGLLSLRGPTSGMMMQESLSQSKWTTETRAKLDVIAKQAADLLVTRATAKGSMDNITALVLLFPWH